MTSTMHYKSNLRDINFNLFEVLDIGHTVLGKKPHANLDEQTAREILAAYEKLCTEEMSKSFAEADRNPLEMDAQGNVSLPKGMKDALKTYYSAGWHKIDLGEEYGGYGAPPSMFWAGFEMLVGANPPAALLLFGNLALHLINEMGTEGQKKRYINNFIERHWGATMVLTEPDAGSDVGAGRTRARHIEGEEWEIEGVKRFITNGEFDTAENILHLTLARPEGAPSGTKGLSLFLVPKYWVDSDGKMGERNGVYCTKVEHKLGIKGSPTCEMTYGEKSKARGLLLGNVHDGIRQMFRVIEHARMAVGTKSMSTLSTAYLNSLDFCKSRIQGPDLAKALDKASPRVAIINHPDVRRMLLLQKSVAEGMRALGMYCANMKDLEGIEKAQGNSSGAKEYEKVYDFLLPLIKGYNSEKAYELLAVSLQCYGGSGYLQDYPIEQYLRDQKIDSLYEGTTHIQSLDLIFRKIAKDGGQTLNKILDAIRETIAKKKHSQLASEYTTLQEACKHAESILGIMMAKMGESIYHAGLQGNRILNSLAELIIGWLLVRHAEVACEKMDNASAVDKNFYTGKIASAQFFCHDCLPNIRLQRELIENGNLLAMEMPNEAF